MYIRVAVNIPKDKTFSYLVPESIAGEASIGKRVVVPFGKKMVAGYILETNSSADVKNIREVAEISDDEPCFCEQDLVFYRWVSRYYLHPLGKTLFDVLPARVSPKTEKVVSLAGAQGPKMSDQQERLVAYLIKQGAVPVSALRAEFKNVLYLIRSLKEKGIIRLEEREVGRSFKDLPAADTADRHVVLTGDQEKAVESILPGLEARRFSPYLLHGVTGSGKTEVYLRLMEAVGKLDGGVILLVPEISLTPQLIARVRGRFAEQEIAVVHSGISKIARHEQWRRIQRGEVKIVIGARSALFVPLKELRLIIVDEEHDGSYKQDDRLRYNARDMAVVRAKLNGATVVLGSATPALQSYYNARKRKYHYLSLPKRIENRDLPAIKIVDMRMTGHPSSEIPIFSRILQEAMAQTLAEKKQTLLFLNRRGFDTVVLCPDCGYIFKCRNCEQTLTHHAALGMLKCHYCDYALGAVSACPRCSGHHIRNYGLGTEKLEAEVKRFFPQARVGRMDSDTTARRGEAEKILKSLAGRSLDILVGTQMVTKGHDFPAITLVGVVAADLSLNVPDFRAGEKTFQILTQVAGRGGRGDSPGLVIVQTFNPEHYAVRWAQEHDYHGFYEDELKLRRDLRYPPFTRLVNLNISSARKEEGRAGVERLGELARSICRADKNGKQVEVLGPAEAPVARIRGRYRWQLLLKIEDPKAPLLIVEVLREEGAKNGLEVKVDVDPMNFM